MYYNAKKLIIIRDQLESIILERSSGEHNHETITTEDIKKLFDAQNINMIKDFSDRQLYSWSGWYMDDLQYALLEVKKLLTHHINIEDQQSIPDSIIDMFHEESRDSELGSVKSIFGELSQKDQNIMRDVARKVHEYTKNRLYK